MLRSVHVRRVVHGRLRCYCLAQMQKARIVPSDVSFNAGISACEKAGEWQVALLLFFHMATARITPDVISYSAAISACEKGCEWQMALCLAFWHACSQRYSECD